MQNKFLLWWKEIDRISFIFCITLIFVGIVLSLTGTTETSIKKGFDSTHYIQRHLIFAILSILLIIGFSLINIKSIRRISALGLIFSILLIIWVISFGNEINGAKRWFQIYGFSIQPSEFLKPFFIVISAWFITKGLEGKAYGFKIVSSLFLVSCFLLILQPDFGMTMLFIIVFFGQLFIAGLSISLVIGLVVILITVLILSYNYMDHVRIRFDSYISYLIDPSCDSCQIEQSIKAFKSGGVFGKGLGQGSWKERTPDSHTDFIFSIAGEELGFIFCCIIIFIFLIIILRGLLKILKKRETYSLMVVVGLVSIFGLQAFINIGSSLSLLPTKGMTLPLISYGGSSMISNAILIGFLLSHTRDSRL